MFGKEKNIKIFEDSVKLMKSNPSLQQSIQASIQNQKLYLEANEIVVPENRNLACRTIVSKKRTFEAAAGYARAGKKVCVLNFASATNPSGGVTRGSSVQEECLCRYSILYPCPNDKKIFQGFYTPHRKMDNPLYNDDCLYTPGVVDFKSDTSSPERMEEKYWYQVDVLTCAAPNLRKRPSNSMNPHAGKTAANIRNSSLYELHMKRLECLFKAAAANKAEVLVLGAFGCGAFCNPPAVVAKAFATVQKKYAGYFETIEYAVFCKNHETENYDTFRRELRG